MPTPKQKNGRGRPVKAFISKKKTTPHVKRSRGRPKKQIFDNDLVEVNDPGRGFSRHSLTTEQKKQRFVWALFIFSVCLFLFSLWKTFGTMPKPSLTGLVQEALTSISGIVETGTDAVAVVELTGTVTTGEQHTGIINTEVPSIAIDTESQLLLTFYTALNEGNLDTVRGLVDSYLGASNMFKTYFVSAKAQELFTHFTPEKMVLSGIVSVPTPKTNIKIYTYVVTYALSGMTTPFTEEWEATLVKYPEGYKIGRMLCKTQGCSKFPFFNQAKRIK